MGFFDFLFSENYKTTSKVYLDENGYYRFKDSDKLVHRWAAEIKLGRRLTRFPVGFPYLEAVDHF